jgi:hypothetical protein
MPGYSQWKLLAHADNAAGASPSISTQAFDTLLLLKIYLRIPGYSGASVARLRFNDDSGTTAYSYSVAENFAAPSTGVAGVASGWNLATTLSDSQALFEITMINSISIEKSGIWQGLCNSLVAATPPKIVHGSGLWINAAAIFKVTLDAGAGGGNLNLGSGISVFGSEAT